MPVLSERDVANVSKFSTALQTVLACRRESARTSGDGQRNEAANTEPLSLAAVSVENAEGGGGKARRRLPWTRAMNVFTRSVSRHRPRTTSPAPTSSTSEVTASPVSPPPLQPPPTSTSASAACMSQGLSCPMERRLWTELAFIFWRIASTHKLPTLAYVTTDAGEALAELGRALLDYIQIVFYNAPKAARLGLLSRLGADHVLYMLRKLCSLSKCQLMMDKDDTQGRRLYEAMCTYIAERHHLTWMALLYVAFCDEVAQREAANEALLSIYVETTRDVLGCMFHCCENSEACAREVLFSEPVACVTHMFYGMRLRISRGTLLAPPEVDTAGTTTYSDDNDTGTTTTTTTGQASSTRRRKVSRYFRNYELVQQGVSGNGGGEVEQGDVAGAQAEGSERRATQATTSKPTEAASETTGLVRRLELSRASAFHELLHRALDVVIEAVRAANAYHHWAVLSTLNNYLDLSVRAVQGLPTAVSPPSPSALPVSPPSHDSHSEADTAAQTTLPATVEPQRRVYPIAAYENMLDVMQTSLAMLKNLGPPPSLSSLVATPEGDATGGYARHVIATLQQHRELCVQNLLKYDLKAQLRAIVAGVPQILTVDRILFCIIEELCSLDVLPMSGGLTNRKGCSKGDTAARPTSSRTTTAAASPPPPPLPPRQTASTSAEPHRTSPPRSASTPRASYHGRPSGGNNYHNSSNIDLGGGNNNNSSISEARAVAESGIGLSHSPMQPGRAMGASPILRAATTGSFARHATSSSSGAAATAVGGHSLTHPRREPSFAESFFRSMFGSHAGAVPPNLAMSLAGGDVVSDAEDEPQAGDVYGVGHSPRNATMTMQRRDSMATTGRAVSFASTQQQGQQQQQSERGYGVEREEGSSVNTVAELGYYEVPRRVQWREVASYVALVRELLSTMNEIFVDTHVELTIRLSAGRVAPRVSFVDEASFELYEGRITLRNTLHVLHELLAQRLRPRSPAHSPNDPAVALDTANKTDTSTPLDEKDEHTEAEVAGFVYYSVAVLEQAYQVIGVTPLTSETVAMIELVPFFLFYTAPSQAAEAQPHAGLIRAVEGCFARVVMLWLRGLQGASCDEDMNQRAMEVLLMLLRRALRRGGLPCESHPAAISGPGLMWSAAWDCNALGPGTRPASTSTTPGLLSPSHGAERRPAGSASLARTPFTRPAPQPALSSSLFSTSGLMGNGAPRPPIVPRPGANVASFDADAYHHTGLPRLSSQVTTASLGGPITTTTTTNTTTAAVAVGIAGDVMPEHSSTVEALSGVFTLLLRRMPSLLTKDGFTVFFTLLGQQDGVLRRLAKECLLSSFDFSVIYPVYARVIAEAPTAIVAEVLRLFTDYITEDSLSELARQERRGWLRQYDCVSAALALLVRCMQPGEADGDDDDGSDTFRFWKLVPQLFRFLAAFEPASYDFVRPDGGRVSPPPARLAEMDFVARVEPHIDQLAGIELFIHFAQSVIDASCDFRATATSARQATTRPFVPPTAPLSSSAHGMQPSAASTTTMMNVGLGESNVFRIVPTQCVAQKAIFFELVPALAAYAAAHDASLYANLLEVVYCILRCTRTLNSPTLVRFALEKELSWWLPYLELPPEVMDCLPYCGPKATLMKFWLPLLQLVPTRSEARFVEQGGVRISLGSWPEKGFTVSAFFRLDAVYAAITLFEIHNSSSGGGGAASAGPSHTGEGTPSMTTSHASHLTSAAHNTAASGGTHEGTTTTTAHTAICLSLCNGVDLQVSYGARRVTINEGSGLCEFRSSTWMHICVVLSVAQSMSVFVNGFKVGMCSLPYPSPRSEVVVNVGPVDRGVPGALFSIGEIEIFADELTSPHVASQLASYLGDNLHHRVSSTGGYGGGNNSSNSNMNNTDSRDYGSGTGGGGSDAAGGASRLEKYEQDSLLWLPKIQDMDSAHALAPSTAPVPIEDRIARYLPYEHDEDCLLNVMTKLEDNRHQPTARLVGHCVVAPHSWVDFHLLWATHSGLSQLMDWLTEADSTAAVEGIMAAVAEVIRRTTLLTTCSSRLYLVLGHLLKSQARLLSRRTCDHLLHAATAVLTMNGVEQRVVVNCFLFEHVFCDAEWYSRMPYDVARYMLQRMDDVFAPGLCRFARHNAHFIFSAYFVDRLLSGLVQVVAQVPVRLRESIARCVHHILLASDAAESVLHAIAALVALLTPAETVVRGRRDPTLRLTLPGTAAALAGARPAPPVRTALNCSVMLLHMLLASATSSRFGHNFARVVSLSWYATCVGRFADPDAVLYATRLFFDAVATSPALREEVTQQQAGVVAMLRPHAGEASLVVLLLALILGVGRLLDMVHLPITPLHEQLEGILHTTSPEPNLLVAPIFLRLFAEHLRVVRERVELQSKATPAPLWQDARHGHERLPQLSYRVRRYLSVVRVCSRCMLWITAARYKASTRNYRVHHGLPPPPCQPPMQTSANETTSTQRPVMSSFTLPAAITTATTMPVSPHNETTVLRQASSASVPHTPRDATTSVAAAVRQATSLTNSPSLQAASSAMALNNRPATGNSFALSSSQQRSTVSLANAGPAPTVARPSLRLSSHRRAFAVLRVCVLLHIAMQLRRAAHTLGLVPCEEDATKDDSDAADETSEPASAEAAIRRTGLSAATLSCLRLLTRLAAVPAFFAVWTTSPAQTAALSALVRYLPRHLRPRDTRWEHFLTQLHPATTALSPTTVLPMPQETPPQQQQQAAPQQQQTPSPSPPQQREEQREDVTSAAEDNLAASTIVSPAPEAVVTGAANVTAVPHVFSSQASPSLDTTSESAQPLFGADLSRSSSSFAAGGSWMPELGPARTTPGEGDKSAVAHHADPLAITAEDNSPPEVTLTVARPGRRLLRPTGELPPHKRQHEHHNESESSERSSSDEDERGSTGSSSSEPSSSSSTPLVAPRDNRHSDSSCGNSNNDDDATAQNAASKAVNNEEEHSSPLGIPAPPTAVNDAQADQLTRLTPPMSSEAENDDDGNNSSSDDDVHVGPSSVVSGSQMTSSDALTGEMAVNTVEQRAAAVVQREDTTRLTTGKPNPIARRTERLLRREVTKLLEALVRAAMHVLPMQSWVGGALYGSCGGLLFQVLLVTSAKATDEGAPATLIRFFLDQVASCVREQYEGHGASTTTGVVSAPFATSTGRKDASGTHHGRHASRGSRASPLSAVTSGAATNLGAEPGTAASDVFLFNAAHFTELVVDMLSMNIVELPTTLNYFLSLLVMSQSWPHRYIYKLSGQVMRGCIAVLNRPSTLDASLELIEAMYTLCTLVLRPGWLAKDCLELLWRVLYRVYGSLPPVWMSEEDVQRRKVLLTLIFRHIVRVYGKTDELRKALTVRTLTQRFSLYDAFTTILSMEDEHEACKTFEVYCSENAGQIETWMSGRLKAKADIAFKASIQVRSEYIKRITYFNQLYVGVAEVKEGYHADALRARYMADFSSFAASAPLLEPAQLSWLTVGNHNALRDDNYEAQTSQQQPPQQQVQRHYHYFDAQRNYLTITAATRTRLKGIDKADVLMQPLLCEEQVNHIAELVPPLAMHYRPYIFREGLGPGAGGEVDFVDAHITLRPSALTLLRYLLGPQERLRFISNCFRISGIYATPCLLLLTDTTLKVISFSSVTQEGDIILCHYDDEDKLLNASGRSSASSSTLELDATTSLASGHGGKRGHGGFTFATVTKHLQRLLVDDKDRKKEQVLRRDGTRVAQSVRQSTDKSYRNLYWAYMVSSIREVRCLRYMHLDTAVILSMNHDDGPMLSIVDAAQSMNPAARAEFIRVLRQILPPTQCHIVEDAQRATTLRSMLVRWATGALSNYDYLHQLNTVAGRTLKDLNQYPVFPWILADYVSARLDLTRAETFRDLALPMGAQTPARRKAIAELYANSRELRDPDTGRSYPFHHGTHYSTSGGVLYYLLRVEPFATFAKIFQGGEFDIAARLFDSVAGSFSSCVAGPADCKELVPEFFHNAAFLRNADHLELGVKPNGELVYDVQLPPWAQGSTQVFVAVMRYALESDYVLEHIHLWIDLIFGVRRRGPLAVEQYNVFQRMTYGEEVSAALKEAQTPHECDVIIAEVENFGQTPVQLFQERHPAHHELEPVKVTTRASSNLFVHSLFTGGGSGTITPSSSTSAGPANNSSNTMTTTTTSSSGVVMPGSSSGHTYTLAFEAQAPKTIQMLVHALDVPQTYYKLSELRAPTHQLISPAAELRRRFSGRDTAVLGFAVSCSGCSASSGSSGSGAVGSGARQSMTIMSSHRRFVAVEQTEHALCWHEREARLMRFHVATGAYMSTLSFRPPDRGGLRLTAVAASPRETLVLLGVSSGTLYCLYPDAEHHLLLIAATLCYHTRPIAGLFLEPRAGRAVSFTVSGDDEPIVWRVQRFHSCRLHQLHLATLLPNATVMDRLVVSACIDAASCHTILLTRRSLLIFDNNGEPFAMGTLPMPTPRDQALLLMDEDGGVGVSVDKPLVPFITNMTVVREYQSYDWALGIKLYLTGHQDGSLSLWRATRLPPESVRPGRIATIEHHAVLLDGSASPDLGAVTAIQQERPELPRFFIGFESGDVRCLSFEIPSTTSEGGSKGSR